MNASSIPVSPPTEVRDGPILSVRDLVVRFRTRRGIETVLNGASLAIPRGATVGLVGESGCGKSTLMKAALGALADNLDRVDGELHFDTTDILHTSAEALRRLRWSRIAMIPQSALNALNPVLRISDQMIEAIRAHTDLSVAEARERSRAALGRVGIDPNRIDQFPHQFTGGMRQRAVIAMALLLEPELVLADEPTTSLDVIVQDQIFMLIRELQRDLGFAMLLVTHDLALVIENCDRVAVMYAGVVVEEGPTQTVIDNPHHPYTMGLRNSMPDLSSDRDPISIPGTPPDPTHIIAGCRFAPRCPFALDLCRAQAPVPVAIGPGHMAACHRAGEADQLRVAAAELQTWTAQPE